MVEKRETRFGVAGREDIAGLTGRQIMQGVLDRTLPAPPIAGTLDFDLVEVGEGLAIFEGATSDKLLNPMGFVHGGWALTLIDSATGCAAMTVLPAGASYTTIETKVNFTRPILKDTGKVRVEGRVISPGRRIILADARLTDATGRLLAHGVSTLMVL